MHYKFENGIAVQKSPRYIVGGLFVQNDIALENAVELNGQVYDNADIEYWKAAKKIELDNYIAACFANGYESNGIKVSTTELSLIKLNQMARLNDENQDKSTGLTVYDYDNKPHAITREMFKSIIKDVGNYMTMCESKYRDGINSLIKAKTIEAVQAIVI